MNYTCFECDFSHRGRECRNCVTRSQYMTKDDMPNCCKGCEYLTNESECRLFMGGDADDGKPETEKQD